MIDFLNVFHVEYFRNCNLGGSDEREYRRFLKTLDDANRELVKLKHLDEDSHKAVF
jgi:hypothetical protein